MARVRAGARVRFRGRAMAGFVVLGLALVAILAATSSEGGTTILHNFAPDPKHPHAPLVADGAGNLYGTTISGGASDLGTIFAMKTDGSDLAVLHSFVGGPGDGSYPNGGLAADGAGNLFGTTVQGGTFDEGTIFRIKADGSEFTILHSFAGGGMDGAWPFARLFAHGANLFGTTCYGGTAGWGTVFRIGTDGSGFVVLHSFAGGAGDGASPEAGLIADGTDTLYGTTIDGGASDEGTVFAVKTDGSGFVLLHSFAGGEKDGSGPYAELLADATGNLYGTTRRGGIWTDGTIFKMRMDGSEFALLHSFALLSGNSIFPVSGLVFDGLGSLWGTTLMGGGSNLGVVFTIETDGSGFTLIHSFGGGANDGAKPYAGLVTDGAGTLYGTTADGGPSDSGTVFTIDPDGSDYALLHSFGRAPEDGKAPYGGLMSDDAGRLYGTTCRGGTSDQGTVFTVRNDGSGFTLLHSFAGYPSDGASPYAGLVADGAGNLYGTTYAGGAGDLGTVFTLRTDGSGYAVLHSFSGGANDGAGPSRGLLVDATGSLYGTTPAGGAADSGTVFTIRTDGSGFAVLHSFLGGPTDGATPYSGLVADHAGNLYGTTRDGGASNVGTVFTIKVDGTSFALLHSFTGDDGASPVSGLVRDGAGRLFGTTWGGGGSYDGTVFALNPDGSAFTVLHSFARSLGRWPTADLLADSAGDLFGTTSQGGGSDLGTVFTVRTDGTGFAQLHSFAGPVADGAVPFGRLVRRGRTFYGTTTYGGANGGGTVFALVNPLWKGSDTPGIYRDSDRQWYLKNTNAPGFSDLEFPYGDPSDRAVVGDWDGDGVDTVGIYRGNTFYLRNTNTAGNADLVIEFGAPGDVPIAGDWDGDGVDTIGVYRPGDAAWYLKNSNTGGAPDLAFTYGLENETPVVGDWNGDGLDTVGIFRASDRQWYLHNANASGDAELVFPYGDPATDVPIVGDWDNDGSDTVGVYRPTQGEWFLKNTNAAGNADLNFTYGILNEKPVVGDWDGNRAREEEGTGDPTRLRTAAHHNYLTAMSEHGSDEAEEHGDERCRGLRSERAR
ncbi:MAG: hypothetical protein HY825_04465 [Acidobacteria bacterium]|nr:hypothetical protein [Acidobacteriota bacterium]